MRRLLLIGLALVLLAAGALVLSPMLIPAKVYKAEIAKAVERSTGRAFRIDGGVKLAILPKVEASLERASLANAEGGKAETMAEIGRLSVGLKLWPLLSRKFEITSFVLEDALIHLEVDQKGHPNWKFEGIDKAEDEAAASKDAKAPDISLGNVRLVNARVTYDDRKSGAHYDLSRIGARLALPSLDSPLKIDGEATYNEQGVKLTLQAGEARALLEGGETTLALDAKSALLNASFDGSGTFGTAPAFTGDTKIDSPSVRKLGKWLGKPIAGSTGFGPLAVSGQATYDDKKLSFAKAQLRFDAIEASGGLTADLSGALPRLTGHLASPMLDLRPYTGGSETAGPVAAAGSSDAKQTEWSSEPIDASALRSFNARFTLNADQILLRNLKIGKSDVVATVEGGILTTDVKELGLYKGIGKGKLVVDGRKTPSSISSDMALSGLDLASFMADAAHSSRFEGIGNFDVDLKGSGHSQKELVENLGGVTKISFKNGAIRGIDLAKIAAIIQGLTGKTDPNAQQATEGGVGVGESTKFVALGANFAVASGIMRTSDFSLINDLLSLTGEGSIDLVHQTIDFKISPGKNQKDGGLRIALKISGPLSHPKITPDASDFLKNELEKRLGASSPEELLQQILTGKKSSEPGKPDEPAPVQKLFDKLLGKKKTETPAPAPAQPAPSQPAPAAPSAPQTETAPAPTPAPPQTEAAPAPSAPAEPPPATPPAAEPAPEPAPVPPPETPQASAPPPQGETSQPAQNAP